MNEEWDLDELKDGIVDELTCNLEDIVEEQVEDAVRSALSDYLPEALNECLGDFEFVLKDGTVVRPRQGMRLLAPDKSKQLCCYGGLRVDGNSLIVQSRISTWECIAVYPSSEEALEALQRVKKALDEGQPFYEL